MMISKYQKLAMRTSPPDHDRVMNGCMGLIGEAGEVVDIVKKWKFQSGKDAEFPKEKFIEECGDVLWYCAELATGLEKDLEYIYRSQCRKFYLDMHELNIHSAAEITACRLSAISVRPFLHLFDAIATYRFALSNDRSENALIEFRKANASAEIAGIMVMLDEMLTMYCHSAIHDAMDRNIEKLLKRYPNGFDAERSLHRDEE